MFGLLLSKIISLIKHLNLNQIQIFIDKFIIKKKE